ncbi:MAG: hypothetical protein WAV22_07245 [Porticoccaceae bacterium]
MTETKDKLIVVLGMHRSGTSAVTKSLELMGVGLGANLHPAGFDNPKGFWEDRDCIQINEDLLRHFCSAYDRLNLAWDEIREDTRVSELIRAAVEIVSRKLGENNRIWGFKDPRTCRLLKFWHQVFIAVKCEVGLVIAVRNPASVAASLAARNGIPAKKAYYLWLQHVLPSLGFMKDARRVVVDYDELLSNPYSQMVRVSTGLGLPLPDREDAMIAEFANEFLENGLRHTCFTEDDLAFDRRAPAVVAVTYNLLRRLATDQASLNSSDVQNQLDELNVRLADASPAFDYINEIEDGVAARDRQLAQMNQVVAARDRQIASLDQVAAERSGQIASLNQVLAERGREIEAYREQAERIVAELHDARMQISHLNQAAAERSGQIANLDQVVAARDRRIASLDQVAAERSGQIDAYRKQAERIVARLDEANTLISHLKEDLAERDRRIARLNEEVTEYVQREVDAGESRLPGGFDPDVYLRLNPDVAAAGLDPKMHYLRHGRREKRPYTLPAADVCGDDGAGERRTK